MRWIRFTVYLLVTYVSCLQAETQADVDDNQAVSTDKDLRKALLQALSDLETSDDLGNSLSSAFSGRKIQTLDKLATTQPTLTTRTEKSVIIETSSGVQYKPIELQSFDQSASTRRPILVKVRNATTARPTTTTPVITSSTEENEAKVESLQFFTAPLVAAFTVHQDELGVPKSVEPILNVEGQSTVTQKELEEKRLKELQEVQKKEAEEKQKEEEGKVQQYLRNLEQVRVQQELEVKQKALQDQIKTLQKQKQQQEEYLLKQQQLIQEQERRKLVLHSAVQQEEYYRKQQLLRQEQERQALLKQANQQKLAQEQERQKLLSSASSSANYNRFTKPSTILEPAFTFQATPHLDNSLQLPSKTHQNFQEVPFNQYQQLPIQGPRDFNTPFHITPLAGTAKNFGQNSPQGNRVFRQETGTGNFANTDLNTRNNPYTNNFKQQLPQQNRFFRSNQNTYSITPSIFQDYQTSRYVRAPYVNNQLNNLLYYSGISRGNQQEDLNLISKVLAYNIRGDNYYSGSDLYEHRLPPLRRSFVIER